MIFLVCLANPFVASWLQAQGWFFTSLFFCVLLALWSAFSFFFTSKNFKLFWLTFFFQALMGILVISQPYDFFGDVIVTSVEDGANLKGGVYYLSDFYEDARQILMVGIAGTRKNPRPKHYTLSPLLPKNAAKTDAVYFWRVEQKFPPITAPDECVKKECPGFLRRTHVGSYKKYFAKNSDSLFAKQNDFVLLEYAQNPEELLHEKLVLILCVEAVLWGFYVVAASVFLLRGRELNA